MKAWVYQDSKQLKKHGPELAAWYVGWLDPDGKRKCQSCGKGAKGKQAAGRLREKIAAELLTGTYDDVSRKTWADFRQEYGEKILPGLDYENRRLTETALNHFEAIVRPGKIGTIKTATIDEYIAKRRKQRGKAKGSTVSRATINKELRHLRAVLRKAAKWGWLPAVPDFAFLREQVKLPTFVSGDEFARLYLACDQAKTPRGLAFPAADWWRALIVMAYMTGWRIGQLLALRRDDVDLKEGTALTRADDNKGGRDQRIKLHPAIIEHLKTLAGFTPMLFPWKLTERPLYKEFFRLQKLAKVIPDGGKLHYGFHDLRRGFATMNADRMTPDALQALMQHKSYLTTQRYINMTRQLDEAVDALHVPDVLKAKKKA